MSAETKFCPDCNTNKPAPEFGYKRPNKLMCRCKICQRLTKKRRWHKNNYKDSRKKWADKNKEKDLAYKKKYRDKHKAEALLYAKTKRRVNPEYKITGNLRHRIWLSLKGGQKSDSTTRLLGCSIEYLKKHLESKWLDGMSWDNYGIYRVGGQATWHIDHIRPCASFDLTDPEQQKQCFHYTNLQPLWAKDNLFKHDKYNLEASK
jgi:hypothetical protein